MPLPAVANVIVPGFALASAMYSFRLLTGTDGLTTSTCGLPATSDTGTRSFIVSNCDLALVQRRIRREVVGLHDQRVAVRRGAHDRLGRDQRVAARAVVDDDLLAHVLRHLLRDDARELVGAAAGRERHEQLDGLVRIALRGRETASGPWPAAPRPAAASISFESFTSPPSCSLPTFDQARRRLQRRAFQHDPIEEPILARVVVGVRLVHHAAVVPDHHVAGPPLVPVFELGLRGVL